MLGTVGLIQYMPPHKQKKPPYTSWLKQAAPARHGLAPVNHAWNGGIDPVHAAPQAEKTAVHQLVETSRACSVVGDAGHVTSQGVKGGRTKRHGAAIGGRLIAPYHDGKV